MDALNWIAEIGFSTYVDIGLMALLIYAVLMWFKSTRSAFIFTGILILMFFYIVVQQLQLTMTVEVLQRFFSVILIALVIIFQEELRGFFERLAMWSFESRGGDRKSIRLSRDEVDVLARTLQDMARKRIGALLILKGRTNIDRHCDGGIPLNGKISEQLLMSLFDPTSIGHDGASIIEKGILTEFSCHLPLSKNLSKIKGAGTRHAAALGLSEHSDAMCIVVSEERGTISIARNGEISVVDDPSRLTYILSRFYQETFPARGSRSFKEALLTNYREKIFALFLSLVLWVVLVGGKSVEQRTFELPVIARGVTEPWRVRSISPTNVLVTLTGPKSSFIWFPLDKLEVYVTPTLTNAWQYFGPTNFNLEVPESFETPIFGTEEVIVRLMNSRETATNNGVVNTNTP